MKTVMKVISNTNDFYCHQVQYKLNIRKQNSNEGKMICSYKYVLDSNTIPRDKIQELLNSIHPCCSIYYQTKDFTIAQEPIADTIYNMISSYPTVYVNLPVPYGTLFSYKATDPLIMIVTKEDDTKYLLNDLFEKLGENSKDDMNEDTYKNKIILFKKHGNLYYIARHPLKEIHHAIREKQMGFEIDDYFFPYKKIEEN
jgi:hypothetical protein